MNMDYLHKDLLVEEFQYAIDRNNEEDKFLDYFVAVAVELPNTKSPEIIINPPENLEAKLSYYKEAYDDNMKLKANSEVRIIDCEWITRDIDVAGFVGDHTKRELYESHWDIL